ncbi:IS66 Orf2 like protein [Photorhabdus namnaonensis]|uniref:IS66 Orf2 like protein n=2 Tax=Photorhabdus namnaonensis TaxID=1851568 RepID=A0A1B8YJS9_9GAMM|nr:IS66 Orf2 like protein [Photorhabdus namnaonensis]
MRRGIDALTQHLEGLNLRWQDEAAFVFCNKARSRLKVLRWDRHGVWLCTRRLHADTDIAVLETQLSRLHLPEAPPAVCPKRQPYTDDFTL